MLRRRLLPFLAALWALPGSLAAVPGAMMLHRRQNNSVLTTSTPAVTTSTSSQQSTNPATTTTITSTSLAGNIRTTTAYSTSISAVLVTSTSFYTVTITSTGAQVATITAYVTSTAFAKRAIPGPHPDALAAATTLPAQLPRSPHEVTALLARQNNIDTVTVVVTKTTHSTVTAIDLVVQQSISTTILASTLTSILYVNAASSTTITSTLTVTSTSINTTPAAVTYTSRLPTSSQSTTTSTPTPQASSGLSTGAIVGIAVGGAVAALALLAGLIICCRRRRRRGQWRNNSTNVEQSYTAADNKTPSRLEKRHTHATTPDFAPSGYRHEQQAAVVDPLAGREPTLPNLGMALAGAAGVAGATGAGAMRRPIPKRDRSQYDEYGAGAEIQSVSSPSSTLHDHQTVTSPGPRAASIVARTPSSRVAELAATGWSPTHSPGGSHASELDAAAATAPRPGGGNGGGRQHRRGGSSLGSTAELYAPGPVPAPGMGTGPAVYHELPDQRF